MQRRRTQAGRPPLTDSIVNAVLEWDIHNWSRALRYWHDQTPDLDGQDGLEIGARNGGLSLYMAWRGARVICSDLAPPGDKARELHRQFTLQDEIQYLAADATRLPFADGAFDLVMAKSVLGGIGSHGRQEQQVSAIAEIHRVLRPGGRFYLAENLLATPAHQFLRRRFVSWGRRWRYLEFSELKSLLSAFSEVDLRSCGYLGALGRTESQRRALGRLDDLFIRLPANCHYLGYGYCTK